MKRSTHILIMLAVLVPGAVLAVILNAPILLIFFTLCVLMMVVMMSMMTSGSGK